MIELIRNHINNNNLFIESPSLNVSYDDLFEQLKGVKQSYPTRIGLIEENSPNFVLAFLTAFIQKHDIVLISRRHPLQQIEKIIRETDIQVLVSYDGLPKISSIENVTFKALESFEFHKPSISIHQYIYFQTSGSTGKAKYVLHSFKTLLANAMGVIKNQKISAESRMLATLPFNHVGGMGLVMRTILSGATLVFSEHEKIENTLSNNPPLAPLPTTSYAGFPTRKGINSGNGLNNTLVNDGITHVSMVPTQLRALLETPLAKDEFPNLISILVGGDHTPKELIEKAKECHLPIQLTYGMTEMGSQVTTTRLDADDAELRTSGRHLPNSDITIDHHGEILVNGSSLALGYYQDGNITALRDENGWFHTGDLGYINHKGQLIVTGRISNLIISGGENIQGENIENALLQIADIDMAYVIGIENEIYGERPIAFIHLHAHSTLTESSLRQTISKSHPSFMIPDAFYIIPENLMNNGIKISRTQLKEFYYNNSSYLLKAFK